MDSRQTYFGRLSQKILKSGKTQNFIGVIFLVWLIHFFFFEFVYIFLDDGGFTTKHWVDFPMILLVSVFLSTFFTTVVYFGLVFYNKIIKGDSFFAQAAKAILAEATFFCIALGSMWLYFQMIN